MKKGVARVHFCPGWYGRGTKRHKRSGDLKAWNTKDTFAQDSGIALKYLSCNLSLPHKNFFNLFPFPHTLLYNVLPRHPDREDLYTSPCNLAITNRVIVSLYVFLIASVSWSHSGFMGGAHLFDTEVLTTPSNFPNFVYRYKKAASQTSAISPPHLTSMSFILQAW